MFVVSKSYILFLHSSSAAGNKYNSIEYRKSNGSFNQDQKIGSRHYDPPPNKRNSVIYERVLKGSRLDTLLNIWESTTNFYWNLFLVRSKSFQHPSEWTSLFLWKDRSKIKRELNANKISEKVVDVCSHFGDWNSFTKRLSELKIRGGWETIQATALLKSEYWRGYWGI